MVHFLSFKDLHLPYKAVSLSKAAASCPAGSSGNPLPPLDACFQLLSSAVSRLEGQLQSVASSLLASGCPQLSP